MLPERYDRVEIGQRIKRVRQLQNMSVQELARKSGVSAGYISEVERGLSAVSVDKLTQIAEGLGTTLDALLCEPGTQPNAEGIVQIPAALSTAADQLHLSHRATLMLLNGRRSLTARRSQSDASDWKVEDWLKFYEDVKQYIVDG